MLLTARRVPNVLFFLPARRLPDVQWLDYMSGSRSVDTSYLNFMYTYQTYITIRDKIAEIIL